MLDVIRIGGLELRFLQTRQSSEGSLDLFEMTAQPNAQMPAAHYHESGDEAVYGPSGIMTFRVDGQDINMRPGRSEFIKRGIVHSFRNHTQEPATCLVCSAPTTSRKWGL